MMMTTMGACRSKNMDKNSANAWGKNEDGTVNTSGPRVVVGDGNIGPQGGFITKYVAFSRCLLLTLRVLCRAGFKGGGSGGPGPRPPTNRGPPTKPFIFFSFVMCKSCIFNL